MAWRKALMHIRSIFAPDVAHGASIPSVARVDPANFPEDRYPLFCKQCDYSLPGLTDYRCPECGREFDRGRLLVEQYVVEGGKRQFKQLNCYDKRILLVGIALVLIPQVALGLAAHVVPAVLVKHVEFLAKASMIAMAIVALALITSMILSLLASRRTKRKSKAVFDAIDRTTLEFKEAQHRRWLILIVWGPVTLGIIVWQLWGSRSAIWHDRKLPLTTLVPVIGGMILIDLAVCAGWRYWSRRDNSGES